MAFLTIWGVQHYMAALDNDAPSQWQGKFLHYKARNQVSFIQSMLRLNALKLFPSPFLLRLKRHMLSY